MFELIHKLLQNNSGYSSKSFFLISITIIGLILLLVPAIVLIIEVYYNHTITTNLSDMATYIAAVSAIFATGGITKAWSERYERTPGPDGKLGTEDDVIVKKKLFDFEDSQKQ